VRFPLHIDNWLTGQPAPVGITVYGTSSNDITIHQTIIPTAFYGGFLAAREKSE
jgi:hypothetical protein